MILYIILARKNSKRLKNKNLLRIGGKTLIEISLNQALQCKYSGKIIISSDIENLKKYDNRKNIIFVKRSKNLSNDKASSDEVIMDLFDKKIINKDDTIVLLQPTSPLRKISTIEKAICLFKKSKKSVISVSLLNKVKDNLYIKNGKIMKKYKEHYLYKQNGAIYVFSANKFIKENKIPDTDFLPIILDYPEDIDIDIEYDFLCAKYFSKNLK